MRALRTYGCFDRTDGKCVIAVIALGVVLAPAGDSQQAGTLFHQLPLYFVENRGQVDEEVLYYLVGRETGVYFAQRGVTYALTGQVGGSPEAGLRELPYRDDWVAASRARWAVKLDFLGTDLATVPQGESPRTAVVSYFKGSGANQTGISTGTNILDSSASVCHSGIGRHSAVDLVKRLGDLVHTRKSRLRRLLAVRLYVDESASDVAFGLGGYLGGAEQWSELSAKWETLLPDGIDCFHMTDFENREGVFKNLGATERVDLIRSLLGCINDAGVVGFGSGLLMSNYEKHVPWSFRGRYDGREAAYMLCFTFFLMKVAALNAIPLTDEPIAVICDRNDEMASMLAGPYNSAARNVPELNMGSLTFDDSRRLPPLQAADILAYEIQKEVSRGVTGRPYRRSLAALDTGKYITGRLDGETITRILAGIEAQ